MEQWQRWDRIAALGRQGQWREALAHLLAEWGGGGLFVRRSKEWQALYTASATPLTLPYTPIPRGEVAPVLTKTPRRRWWLVTVPPNCLNPSYALLCPADALSPDQARFWAEVCATWLTVAPEGWKRVIDSFPEPTLVTDTDGALLAWNAAAETQWGAGGMLEQGRALWTLGASLQDGECLQELLRLGTSGGVVTLKVTDTPTAYRVLVAAMPSGHRLWRFLPLHLDAQAFHHLARSFQVATLGELASGIAHEINNPLQVIVGNLEMALDEGNLDEGTREKLTDALTAAHRIRQITHSLIHFADARRTHEAELLDINAAIREAVQLASYALARDGIKVTAECAPQALLVLGRRGDLEEVVVQLVRNAGEAILQARKGTQVVVRTRQRNGWGRIEVDDDGPGVPAELRDRIFIPFVTTKAERGGTGLGLAIVQNIVVAHRGRVWVEESPLGGARFVVELPLWQPATPSPDPTPPTEATPP